MFLKSALWLSLTIHALAAPGKPPPPGKGHGHSRPIKKVHLGPRPFWLIEQMEDSPLKKKLESCTEMEMKPTAWSIGHRGGGTLQFPEETYNSIMAGTRMGAAIQECDVTFSRDLTLICRHSQCDLHTTTNLLTIPSLAAKCSVPFTPANSTSPASAKCCTSDFTSTELSTLCSKMDGFNPNATTPAAYLDGTPKYRTDLYAKTCSPILTLREYIQIVDDLGLQFTPELKTPEVPMPFPNNKSPFTQTAYAQAMLDEFKTAKIHPSRVWPQSFLYADILYWLKAEPAFGKQAVLLDESADTGPMEETVKNLTRYAKDGVKIVAPPLPYLVTVNNSTGTIIPSDYAKRAKELGLEIITWSLERSGWLGDGSGGGYYFESVKNVIKREGDVYKLLDVLAREVGVKGVFSDWSGTVTFYANCLGLVW